MTPSATHWHAAGLSVVTLQYPYELRLLGQVGNIYRPDFGESHLQIVEADGFAEMSHALFVARGE